MELKWHLVGALIPGMEGGCIQWVPSAYIQTDPGRRAGGSHLRAVGVSRLNEVFRVFSQIEISLIINYLPSPIGLCETKDYIL